MSTTPTGGSRWMRYQVHWMFSSENRMPIGEGVQRLTSPACELREGPTADHRFLGGQPPLSEAHTQSSGSQCMVPERMLHFPFPKINGRIWNSWLPKQDSPSCKRGAWKNDRWSYPKPNPFGRPPIESRSKLSGHQRNWPNHPKTPFDLHVLTNDSWRRPTSGAHGRRDRSSAKETTGTQRGVRCHVCGNGLGEQAETSKLCVVWMPNPAAHEKTKTLVL